MYRIKIVRKKLPNTKITLQKRILGFIWIYWWGSELYGYDIDFHLEEEKIIIEALEKEYKISEVKKIY